MRATAALVTLLTVGILFPSSPWAAPAAPPRPATAAAIPPGAAAPLDLNKASKEALLAVPGIGPAMAQRIIDLRGRKGGFTRLEELLEVRGVGEKNLARLAEFLTVPPAAAAAATIPKKP